MCSRVSIKFKYIGEPWYCSVFPEVRNKRKKESNSINNRKLKIIKSKDAVVLKSRFHLPKKYFICFNTRHLEMVKDTFYCILKAHFVPNIFRFLS